MDINKVGRTVLVGVIVLFVCGTSALGFLRWSIQAGLDRCCETAQEAYPHPGDDVAAMLEYVQSDSHSLKDRNLIVWALGQARDSRALPILECYLTGQACDHDEKLCQGELGKAIALCRENAPNLLLIKTP